MERTVKRQRTLQTPRSQNHEACGVLSADTILNPADLMEIDDLSSILLELRPYRHAEYAASDEWDYEGASA